MRKLLLGIAAAAALLISNPSVDRAEAITFGAPAGILDALEDVATIEQVHCIPGFRHHRPTYWRRADGCLRRRVIVPHWHWYGGHRHFHHRHFHRHHHRHHHHRHHHRHRHHRHRR